MAEPMDIWPFAQAGADPADPADPAARARLARSFARCFEGPEGARAIAHLQRVTLGRALGPDASDAALRDLEGQRRLVRAMLALIDRGRDGR